jgi:hypothetical protein
VSILEGLAAGLSSAPQGFIKGREAGQQIEQTDIQQAGDATAGRFIQQFFNAPVPGAQPMQPPAPGAPSQPQGMPQQQGGPMAALQGLLQRFQGGGQPQQPPQVPQGAPPQGGPPQMAQVPGAQPMPGSGPPQRGQGLPQQGMQQPMAPQGGQPQGQGGPQAQGGMAPGQMTWQQIVQGVVRSNPGVKDPRVIFAAVNRLMPLMQMNSQNEFRQLQMQYRQMMLENAQQRTRDMEDMNTWRRGGGAGGQGGEFGRSFQGQLLSRYMQEHPEASLEDALQAIRPQSAGDKKAQANQEQAHGVIDQIDSAISSIDESMQGGEPVTGVTGMGERMLEWGKGVVGMEGSAKTPASDFQTKVRLIQQQLPRVLTGAARISESERAHLDDVVRGLGKFTSPQQAKNALEYVKSVLQTKAGPQHEQRSAPTGQPSGGGFDRAAAKKAGYSDAEIDQFLKGQK